MRHENELVEGGRTLPEEDTEQNEGLREGVSAIRPRSRRRGFTWALR